MEVGLYLLISVFNGLQYGYFGNLFASLTIEAIIIPQVLEKHQLVLLSVTNRVSQLLAAMLVKPLIRIAHPVLILKILMPCMLILSFQMQIAIPSFNQLLLEQLIFGFTTQMQTTLIPTIIASNAASKKSQYNMIFQVCINIGLIMSSYVLFLMERNYINDKLSNFMVHFLLNLGLLVLLFMITSTNSSDQSAENQMTLKQMMKKKECVLALKVSFLIAFMQQVTGACAFDTYRFDLLLDVFNFPNSNLVATIIIQFIDVVLLAFAVLIIKRAKRKFLLVFGLLGCAISNLVDYFVRHYHMPKYLLFVSKIIFSVSYQLGPGGLNYVLCSEAFPENNREFYFSMSQFSKRIMNMVITSVYPLAKYETSSIVFALGCLLTIYYAKKLLPETQGKQQQYINQYYREKDVPSDSYQKQV